MKRISITFYDEVYDKLEKRMHDKGVKSTAQCVRELLDLGFRIEEVAAKREGQNDENDELKEIMNLLKNNLKWTLETRFFTRFMVENMTEIDKKTSDKILDEFMSNAQSYVKGLTKDKLN